MTIGIGCAPESELWVAVDVAIEPLPGAEIVAGSTRMKAATATKMVLNMLTTGSFIRRGYVFGNLMVNVQPKNSKLADRAQRIIARAAGISYEKAGEMLVGSANSVGTAIVMARTGVSREEAERRLAAGHGRISEALRK